MLHYVRLFVLSGVLCLAFFVPVLAEYEDSVAETFDGVKSITLETDIGSCIIERSANLEVNVEVE